MTYIMTPTLYNSLSNVRGFMNLNGKTYQLHILTIFNNLDDKIKNEIMETTDDYEALKILQKYNIEFTHKY